MNQRKGTALGLVSLYLVLAGAVIMALVLIFELELAIYMFISLLTSLIGILLALADLLLCRKRDFSKRRAGLGAVLNMLFMIAVIVFFFSVMGGP